MEQELPAVLLACANPATVQQANAWLVQAKAANFPQFMVVLSNYLRDAQQPAEGRQQAGLQLKNCVSSKDDRQQEVLHRQWNAVAVAQRTHIKQSAIATLGSEPWALQTGSTAAQVIAAIAEAEMPEGMWPDVIPTLLHLLGAGQPDPAKVAALEAIGYICEPEDLHRFLEANANEILTAVIHHMRKDEPNIQIKRAAISALISAVQFTQKNFEAPAERTAIMTAVCEATLSQDFMVKLKALECLGDIMESYYEHMEQYMQALFTISLDAIKTSQETDEGEKVVLQGIEFWNRILEAELDIIEEIEQRGGDALGAATAGIRVYKQYAKGAHLDLVPIMLNLMIQTIETEDEDDPDMWNPAKAAVLNLELYANVCRDKILPIVMPFTEGNLGSQRWQNRDAAVMAFAAVLNFDPPVEQEKKTAIIAYVRQAVPPVVGLMNPTTEPSVVVRDSVAYLISMIIQETPEAVLPIGAGGPPPEYLQQVCMALHAGLGDDPRVALQACSAIHKLAMVCSPLLGDGTGNPAMLTPFLEGLIQALFGAATSADATNELRLAVFEALASLISASAAESYPVVVKTTTEIMTQLDASVAQAAQVTNEEQQQTLAERQGHYLAVLQSCIEMLQASDIESISDRIMTTLLALIVNTATGKTSMVKEEVLLTLSPLIGKLGPKFERYLAPVKPHLLAGLQNAAESAVCGVCVGCVADLATELGPAIAPHCDEIMTGLLHAVGNAELERDHKPNILSAFADIAMAVNEGFQKYFEPTALALQGAAQMSMADSSTLDIDEIDYFNDLREGVLTAYAGMIIGFKGNVPGVVNPAVQVLQTQVQFLVGFMQAIFQDTELTDDAKKASLGLLGDLCDAFGPPLAQALPPPFCLGVVNAGGQSQDPDLQQAAILAAHKFVSIGIQSPDLQRIAAMGTGQPGM